MAITFVGSTAGLAILGNEALTQNLFVIENRLGSRVDVNVRRLLIQLDHTAVLTSVMPLVKTSRATGISGGAALPGGRFNTALAASGPKVVMSAAVADALPIVATAGNIVWQQYLARAHTLAEQFIAADGNALPAMVANSGKEFKLRPNESMLVQVVAPTVATNTLQMNNWFVACSWEEDSIATFAISGQVTLSAVGVAGAKVVIIEADDELMTNAVLVETKTSDGSGNWSSSISVGKVGVAFTQYKSGPTYYTALSQPYLKQ